jgi:hypothetical protein
MNTQTPANTSPKDVPVAKGPGSGRLFLGFLILATVVLAVLVTLLSLENRRLKASLSRVIDQSMPASLAVGRAVPPIEVTDRTGSPATLLFAGQAPATLVMVISGSCDQCQSMIPVWARQIDRASNPRVRIVCIQTDAVAPDLFEKMEQSWPLYGGIKGKRGWVRDVPIVPATLLLDAGGVITHTWLGRMDDEQAEALMFALIGAGAESASVKTGG